MRLSSSHRLSISDRDAARTLTFAIGDVHGHEGKLEALLQKCERHAAGREMRVVFIGDYIDRGPDSRRTIERLIELQSRTKSRIVCLRGNHEAVAVAAARDALDALGDVDLDVWLSQGGGQRTLHSYGIADARHLPTEHVEWMASLPMSFDDGARFFVHAGINPARALADQVEKDLLWMREPFLSHAADFGRLIVHGHTPTSNRVPEWHGNRLNVDTAAGYGGPLTAAVFCGQGRKPVAFLADSMDSPFALDASAKAQFRD